MWSFIKQLLVFRIAQKSSRGVARTIGFGKLGMIIGLIGGWRALKKHRHSHA